MIRVVLVAASLIACGKSDSKPAPAPEPLPIADRVSETPCELMRDKYLAWTADRVAGAVKGMPAEQRPALQAEADKEAKEAREKFVAACEAMGSTLDETCFEKNSRRCDKLVRELETKMFGH